jgi:transposase
MVMRKVNTNIEEYQGYDLETYNVRNSVGTETLSVKGMCRKGNHIGKSMHDAGIGELNRQIEYKSKIRGVAHVQASRFFPSTQCLPR